MRRRVLLAIGLAFLFMLLVIAGATRWVLATGFASLERRYLEQDVAQVRGVIEYDLAALSRTNRDWSAWDETYDFVETGSPRYIADNLDEAVFANLRLSAMLWVQRSGRITWGASYDLRAERPGGFPDALARYVAEHPALSQHEDPNAAVAGLAVLPDGATLLVSRPILDSQYRKPIRGSLVMARLLDAEEVRELGRRVRLSVLFLRLEDPTVPGGLVGESVAIEPFGRDRVAAYSLLADLDGRPALALRIDQPADIRRQGVVTLIAVLAWVLLTGGAFAAAVVVFLERSVLARLQALSAGVLAVGTGDDPSCRVTSTGRDAIAYLGAAINGMLDSIERSTGELRSLQQRTEAFLDAIPDQFFRVRRDGTILDARLPTGLATLPPSNRLVGVRAQEIPAIFPPVSREFVERGLATLEETLATGAPRSLTLTLPIDLEPRTFECRLAAAGSDEAIVLVRDITMEVTAEEARRREILLKEIHHRVKNNLQVITSLLALQARSSDDPRVSEPLAETRDRVRSMALLHEKLYEASEGRISFSEYVGDLVAHLRHSLAGDSQRIEVALDIQEVALDLDAAVPCGLVINELLTNSLKYAFPGERRGRIDVSLARRADGLLALRVADDGVGMPPETDARSPVTLGLRIVNILAGQLKGTLEVERPVDGGTAFILTFPV